MATLNLAYDSENRSHFVHRFLTAKSTSGIAILLLIPLVAFHSLAQESRPTESQVEAAYIFNFGKFVTFPADRASRSDSFGICILGENPLQATLESIVQGESIGGKKITVQKLSKMQAEQPCSILFVSPSEDGQLAAILALARKSNLLTVSDMKGFAERGGIIELVRQQNRIRFEVNLKAAQESGLTLSSELLKVAIRVIQKDPKGAAQ